MAFTNKSLHTSRSNMSFIKGATLFFLGMTCVMVMTQALEVKSIATNAIQYISKVVLTASGTSASATGIYLDGVSGNGYFAGKVGIGTGASNIYTINTNGGLRVGDGESSSRYGAIYSDNGFYKTYIGKYTDENNTGSINYGILINGSGNFGNFGNSMMGLRVIMEKVTRRAATFIGRVGIGTDAPAYDLDVVGTGRFSSGLIVNGNMGIGTQTPASTLHVNGTGQFGDSLKLSSTSSYSTIQSEKILKFNTSGAITQMTINTGGNVGIGVTPSTEKLYVAGSVRFTGSAQVGYDNNTGRCTNSGDAGKIIYTSMCKSSAGDRTITPTFLGCIMSGGVAPVQKILLTGASWVDAIEGEACPATQILETSVQ